MEGFQLYLNVMLSLKVHCILFSSVGHTTNIQIKPYHASSVRLKEDKNNKKTMKNFKPSPEKVIAVLKRLVVFKGSQL